MHGVRREPFAKIRRLLRFLQLRLEAVPAGAAGTPLLRLNRIAQAI
jgi:hypothetical protein